MAEPYAGIPKNETELQLPDDNDVADSESVDVGLRTIWDSIRLLNQVEASRPTHQLVSMRSFDGVSIVFNTIPQFLQNINQFAPYHYVFYNKDTVTMTVSELDTGGGAFEVNTIYYCYIRWHPVDKKFVSVITKQFPDETLCFQKADPSLTRYLGAFFTDAAKKIKPIGKSAAYYTYDLPEVVLTQTTDVAGTADLTPRIPIYCSKVKLFVDITGNTVNNILGISPSGGAERQFAIGNTTTNLHFPIDVSFTSNKIISARWGVGAGSSASIRLEGMYES
jgi:hypothetical protein